MDRELARPVGELDLRGDLDTTYQTQQRDMFTSGLAASIGVNAFAVWHAIKSHADFQTGECWPGIRRLMDLTGLSTDPTQAAIKKLKAFHLLRVSKRGRRNHYVARERMDVRIGKRVICTVVIDYIPALMRDKLAALKAAASEGLHDADVWAQVELLPGPGMTLNAESGNYQSRMRVDEVPETAAEIAGKVRKASKKKKKLKGLAEEMRANRQR